MVSSAPSSALSAVLAALGREEDAASIADPSADAAELIAELARANPALADAIAVGEYTSTTCALCHTPKVSAGPRRPYLEVDVAAPRQATLHGAFKYACEPDQYGDESAPLHECNLCQRRTPALRRVYPCAPWPKQLCIVLRRNAPDYASMCDRKATHRVAFPRSLDLPALCEVPLGQPSPPEYQLAGAIVHTGSSTRGGSYAYEASHAALASCGLDDKMAVLDAGCPGGATPYVLVYARGPPSASTVSVAASVGSGSAAQTVDVLSSKPATAPAEAQKGPSRWRRDCCCSVM